MFVQIARLQILQKLIWSLTKSIQYANDDGKKNHWDAFKICLFGQTTKQSLSNFEPWKSYKYKHPKKLTLIAYKKA